jgi:ribonuclease J
MQLVKPKFVVPVHAYYLSRKHVTRLADEAGFPKEKVMLLDNGDVAELVPNEFKVTNEKVPTFYVMVDGLGVGDVEEVVIRDRRVLAQEGMVVIILTIDRANGKVLKNPDIISRGFIYLKDNHEILNDIRKRIRGVLERIPKHQPLDADYLKTLIRNQIGQFLFNRTHRRPMVLPVVIEI